MGLDDLVTSDCAPDGPEHFGPTGNSKVTKPWDGAASRFTDPQYKTAAAACDPGDGSVKERCFLPHHEPGGAVNVNGVHAAAQRVSSLKGHSPAAVATAKAHLRSHYKALGEDPPAALTASNTVEEETFARWDAAEDAYANGLIGDPELAAKFGQLHGSFSGKHSHPHSPYGQQGDDATHDHAHAHQGDNLHRHSHATTADAGRTSIEDALAAASGPWWREPSADELAEWEASRQSDELTAAASADPMLGARWAISQSSRGWQVIHRPELTAAAVAWAEPVGTYVEALSVLGQELAKAGDTRSVLSEGWKSEMAFEGVPTGDGRYINPGAIEYRDTPLPLMLQTETAPGHQGAVLAGAINQTGKLGNVAIGSGDYDASDAGRQFQQIVNARGRFGVSIDVADADGEPACPDHGDPENCPEDCTVPYQVNFSLIRVMGVTGTPFPAFEDAYICADTPVATSADQPVAADGAPCHECDGQTEVGTVTIPVEIDGTEVAEATFPLYAGKTPVLPASTGLGGLVTASAATVVASPPRDWFDKPAFHVGDGRLVQQPDGFYACPLTVTSPDPDTGLRKVFGHMAAWNSCHTGYVNQCVRPPRSQTDYAAFNVRPIVTDDGELVNVGHLTMGVGHAETTGHEHVEDVRAHYDGGPGAIRMAHVRAGEDEFGIWFSGYIDPDATEAQVQAFAMCSVSGDWRSVWRGKGTDLVACLAGVSVPGFTIAQALAAAGMHVDFDATVDFEPKVAFENGVPVAMVAMGAIRQPYPWERTQADQGHLIASLTARLAAVEAVSAELAPVAAARLQEALSDDQAPAVLVASAPTKEDPAITDLIVSANAAVHKALAAQVKDPDNASDPADKAVMAALTEASTALGTALKAQAVDGAPDGDDAKPTPPAAPAKPPVAASALPDPAWFRPIGEGGIITDPAVLPGEGQVPEPEAEPVPA